MSEDPNIVKDILDYDLRRTSLASRFPDVPGADPRTNKVKNLAMKEENDERLEKLNKFVGNNNRVYQDSEIEATKPQPIKESYPLAVAHEWWFFNREDDRMKTIDRHIKYEIAIRGKIGDSFDEALKQKEETPEEKKQRGKEGAQRAKNTLSERIAREQQSTFGTETLSPNRIKKIDR